MSRGREWLSPKNIPTFAEADSILNTHNNPPDTPIQYHDINYLLRLRRKLHPTEEESRDGAITLTLFYRTPSGFGLVKKYEINPNCIIADEEPHVPDNVTEPLTTNRNALFEMLCQMETQLR